jgi:RNA polymerase sigma-70 factor (ECF subfamily)
VKPDSTVFPALESDEGVLLSGRDHARDARAGEDETDGQLVEAARRGEVRAFEDLLARHEGRVLRVLRLMGVPAQDREDVAQEVLLRVFRHLDRFQSGRPFRSWIYRISVNAAHDYRSRCRRDAYETPLDSVDDPRDRGADPATAAERGDLRDRLLRHMGRLSDRERAVFVLVEIEGIDTREVARSLGIARVTVRRHLGRARRHLGEALGEPVRPD